MFNPTDPLRKLYHTSSSFATEKGWSPYKPNQPISEYLSKRGNDLEKRVIELKLKKHFKKVEDSFVCDQLKLLGTPDIVTLEGNVYGEIKGVFRKNNNLEEVLEIFEDEFSFLRKAYLQRKKINIFSHIVQCVLNMYVTEKYHQERKEFYLFYWFLYHYDPESCFQGLRLKIFDRTLFEDWVELALSNDVSTADDILKFLEVKFFDVSKLELEQ